MSSIFDYLEQQFRARAVPRDPALPFDFQLGYVGYLGYELKAETGGSNAHESPYHDAALAFTDRAVVIDHDQRCTYLLVLSRTPDDPRNREWFGRTEAIVRRIARSRRTSIPGLINAAISRPISVTVPVPTARASSRVSI